MIGNSCLNHIPYLIPPIISCTILFSWTRIRFRTAPGSSGQGSLVPFVLEHVRSSLCFPLLAFLAFLSVRNTFQNVLQLDLPVSLWLSLGLVLLAGILWTWYMFLCAPYKAFDVFFPIIVILDDLFSSLFSMFLHYKVTFSFVINS